MSELITIGICLTDLPKDKVKVAENGKKYINLCVSQRREPDQYGNTHTVFAQQTREERNARVDKCYVGNGKAYITSAPRPETISEMPAAENFDDLPY